MEELRESGDKNVRGTCEICKSTAVTRVPVRALKPQTVRRYIFGQPESGRDVALCGVCTMLHCEETFEGDGPERLFSRADDGNLGKPGRSSAGRNFRHDDDEAPQSRQAGSSYDYANALLRMLERSGYHIYLRSDGRQLILSHEDGLDRQTRGQVERYRREITDVIIERLWESGA